MSGERLEQRLLTSDGGISAINVQWSGDVNDDATPLVAAIELAFSNGMSTTPMYRISGLAAEDIEEVAAELSFFAAGDLDDDGGPHPVDVTVVEQLERAASTKLLTHEAMLLQQSKLTCPICLGAFARNHTILCLPCGRSEGATGSHGCHGHLGHLKCLKAEFKRRDGCPLCRAKLPAGGDKEGTEAAISHARANLQHLRLEASTLREMSKAESKATAVARRAAGGASATGGRGGGGASTSNQRERPAVLSARAGNSAGASATRGGGSKVRT